MKFTGKKKKKTQKTKRTTLEKSGGAVSLIMELQIVVREKGLSVGRDMTYW